MSKPPLVYREISVEVRRCLPPQLATTDEFRAMLLAQLLTDPFGIYLEFSIKVNASFLEVKLAPSAELSVVSAFVRLGIDSLGRTWIPFETSDSIPKMELDGEFMDTHIFYLHFLIGGRNFPNLAIGIPPSPMKRALKIEEWSVQQYPKVDSPPPKRMAA